MVDDAIAHFDAADPSAIVPALVTIRARIDALGATDPLIAANRAQLDRVLQACVGLRLDVAADRPEAVPGETITLKTHWSNSAAIPGRFVGRRILVDGKVVAETAAPSQSPDVTPPGEASTTDSVRIPGDAPLTQPYWLREEGSAGIARVSDPALLGLPESPPVIQVVLDYAIGGKMMSVNAVPTFETAGVAAPVVLVPPVSMEFTSDVYLIAPGTTKEVAVRV
ncbi:MAG TPA: hypothetical protein VIK52_07530, partial [Opitutaceae bacterium]